MPTYKIHDNGGTPFTVAVDKTAKTAVVTSWGYDFDTEKRIKGPVVLTTGYEEIWIGRHSRRYEPEDYYEREPGQLGNTILLRVKGNTYIWIGWKILQFTLPANEIVVAYDSPIGNNDVPYPAVFTNRRVLLMIEEVSVPNDALNLKGDPYAQYYGHGSPSLKKRAARLRAKVLVPRQI